MLQPFPFLAEAGIRPPTSILWQFEPIHRHVLPVASHGMCWTVISNNLSTTSHALSPPLTQTIKGVGVALCNRLTLEEPTGRSGSTISLIKTTDGGATWEVKPFGPGSFVHAVYPETCAPCVRFVMGHCDSQVYWTELDWRRLEDGLWFFAENDHSKTWSLSQVEELTRVARMYQHDIRMWLDIAMYRYQNELLIDLPTM